MNMEYYVLVHSTATTLISLYQMSAQYSKAQNQSQKRKLLLYMVSKTPPCLSKEQGKRNQGSL